MKMIFIIPMLIFANVTNASGEGDIETIKREESKEAIRALAYTIADCEANIEAINIVIDRFFPGMESKKDKFTENIKEDVQLLQNAELTKSSFQEFTSVTEKGEEISFCFFANYIFILNSSKLMEAIKKLQREISSELVRMQPDTLNFEAFQKVKLLQTRQQAELEPSFLELDTSVFESIFRKIELLQNAKLINPDRALFLSRNEQNQAIVIKIFEREIYVSSNNENSALAYSKIGEFINAAQECMLEFEDTTRNIKTSREELLINAIMSDDVEPEGKHFEKNEFLFLFQGKILTYCEIVIKFTTLDQFMVTW